MKIKRFGALLVSAVLCIGMAAPAFAFEGDSTPVEQPVLPEIVEEEDTVTITAERVKRVIHGYGEGKNATEGTGGSFSYYELGEPLLLPSGNLNEKVGTEKIRDYIWYTETKKPLPDHKNSNSYFLGENNSTAYYFFYEPQKVCVLNYDFVATIPEKAEGYIIYADRCTLSEQELQ